MTKKLTVAVLAVLLLISLIGCSSGASTKQADATTATSSTEAEKTEEPITVYPEAGHKRGIVQSGKSVEFNPIDNGGLTYRCKPGLKSLRLPYLRAINYNGTVIWYDEDSVERDNKKGKFTGFDQLSISLTFDGKQNAFSQKAVSLIVHTTGMKFAPGDYENVDEYVVNLTPEMIERGVVLYPTRFGFVESLSDIDFCLRK